VERKLPAMYPAVRNTKAVMMWGMVRFMVFCFSLFCRTPHSAAARQGSLGLEFVGLMAVGRSELFDFFIGGRYDG
jgi:hypothetical protein